MSNTEIEEFINEMLSLGECLTRCTNNNETQETYKEARDLYKKHVKAIKVNK